MSKRNKNNFEPEVTEEEIVEEVVEENKEDSQNDDVEELKMEYDSEIEVAEEEKEEIPTPTIGTVNCSKLNVRQRPSLTSAVLKVLNMNDTVIITGKTNPVFYEIEVEDNETGFVMKEFINL